jgi:hypothetical protein
MTGHIVVKNIFDRFDNNKRSLTHIGTTPDMSREAQG